VQNTPFGRDGPGQSGRAMPNLTPRGKLKTALDLMIWGGEDGLAVDWVGAAKLVGLRTRTLRLAIQKPHVRTYLNEQRRAMLAGISAKNISRAAAIRDQDENRTAAVNAIRFLEDGGNSGGPAGPVRVPGVVIQIIGG
jgi:hypothetical protein